MKGGPLEKTKVVKTEKSSGTCSVLKGGPLKKKAIGGNLLSLEGRSPGKIKSSGTCSVLKGGPLESWPDWSRERERERERERVERESREREREKAWARCLQSRSMACPDCPSAEMNCPKKN